MGLAQMAALGGSRKMRRPYVEEINRRTPYLPQLYAQKKQKEQSNRMWGLQQQGLAQERKMGLANLDIQRDIAHEARKKNRIAQNLGFANLGLSAALGGYEAMGQPSLSDVGDWFSPSDIYDVGEIADFGGEQMLGGFYEGAGGGGDFWSGGGLYEGALEDIIGWL